MWYHCCIHGWGGLPPPVKKSVVLWDTIIDWREFRKSLGLPYLTSKWMPLWSLPDFPQGRDNTLARLGHGGALERVGHLFT